VSGAARLFVALELPEAVVDALVAWRAPLCASGGGSLRPVAVEGLHVTLCFLGERPESAIAAIGAVVERCGEGADGGGLALGAPLWLPRRRPRVLAVEVGDADGRLAALQRAVSDALVAGGWHEPESRPFLSHVTVARVRGTSPDVALGAPAPVRFDGSALTLFRSRLRPDGAHYEPQTRVVLA
jgi:2'-5' RNA ligase